MTTRPHVVILGGGFGGLNVAKGLKGAPVDVTVVDRHNHHLFQPMLYQVATAALSPGDIASPIRSILRRRRNVEVLLDEAVAVDTAARQVRLASGATLTYDYLAVATGANHSYFGHDEWAPFAPGLKTIEDALEIRRRILLAFEYAEMEPDPVARQAYLNFVIVGGGPTGVELAGALAEIKRYVLRRDFRRIDPREAIVILIEGSKRILPTYPPSLSEKAKQSLRDLGVDVRTEMMVTGIEGNSVLAGGWRIPAHTIIWAAGNRASPLLATLSVPLDRQGRVLVEPDCTIPGHPEVFVLGDAANFAHDPNGALPGVCPVAMQMGTYAARTIRDAVRNRPGRRPFHYWNKGELAVIGRGRAVANIRRLRFGGVFAWLAWIFIHIFFLIGFRNRLIVMIEWAISYLTYSRGARLITGRPADRPPTPADVTA
ncbi:MAG TPA: NAD(P)/FAD-dependent oxidoreductase [Gemmatimonadales bacterium]|nr:NAD(P)/FAD-dependent oxidoreductase [Gemmatimonadales bacterium]